MPDLFEFVGKYFWLLGIGTMVLNVFIYWRRAAPAMAQNPELQEGYNRLFSGYAAVSILPWLVMGLGIWLGGVPSIWHYFRLRDGHPWVLAWWGTLIGLQLILFLWIFFQGGAEYLAAHPAFQIGRSKLPIKWQILLSLLGSMLAMVWLWFIDFPVDF